MSKPRRAKKMFVAMPFREHYDKVFGVIKECAALLGIDVVQLAEESFSGSIISKLRSEIEDADIMTAIVTEENGNVYYEIGLAHCQQKPVVLLTANARNLKFDLRDHRAIVYDPNRPQAIKNELTKTLNAVLVAYDDPKSFLNSAFGNPRGNSDSDSSLHDAVEKVAETASLQHPVRLEHYELTRTNELAIEVSDFMGSKVRAIVDINGLVRKIIRS